MNNYKLIKLEQGYIIVSDEKIKDGDTIIYPIKTIIPVQYLGGDLIGTELKVIASTFIPELPNINFNDLEEEFGIIDIEKLADKYLDSDERLCNNSFNGFIEGFNKCLELNKNKLYTEEQMLDMFNAGRSFEIYQLAKNLESFKESKNPPLNEIDYLKSLKPKTEWDIEVEMETKCYCGHTSYCECEEIKEKLFIQRPKIINNKIKIINIK